MESVTSFATLVAVAAASILLALSLEWLCVRGLLRLVEVRGRRMAGS